MSKESKHAAELRQLGFEPYTEGQEAYRSHRTERRVTQLLGRPPTRNERRIAKKFLCEPGFLLFEDNIVHANDELGNGWRFIGKLNPVVLEKMGFRNKTLEALLTQSLLPPLPPEKPH